MGFVKKIFDKKIDEGVHSQFVRFGKGIFGGRAVINMWKTSKIKVRGSFEYANDFVDLAAEFGGGKVLGIVLSKNDISNIMSQDNIKGNSETKKGGLYYENNITEQELNSSKLKTLLANSYFALLDIEGNGFILKIKKKLPKPGKGEGKTDDKFCNLEGDLKYWTKLKEQFLWDIPEDAKKAHVTHTYEIKEIVMPQGEKDFEKIRVLAKRKGKLTRDLDIDNNKIKKEIDFEA